MYDSTCKFIACEFSEDIASWLLGQRITLTELKPSELSVEPIRADNLIFLQSDDLILHLEFQTNTDENLPFRILDYRLRLYRLYPQKTVIQVVIYLRKTSSSLAKQNYFQLQDTRHYFQVIRLWEMPSELFLQSKGLLPFAILSQTENRENTLRQVRDKIEEVEARRQKSNLAASTAILAGLVLKQETIKLLLKNDIMKESVIYQEILAEGKAEGEAKGEAKGIAKGRREGEISLILRLLNRRFGELSPRFATQIQNLSLEKLEDLGERLLDFQTEDDLKDWLETI